MANATQYNIAKGTLYLKAATQLKGQASQGIESQNSELATEPVIMPKKEKT